MAKASPKSKLFWFHGQNLVEETISGQKTMKKTLKYIALGLLATSVTTATLTTTGCARNEYKRSSGEYLDDQTLTARVKSALFSDPNVSGFQVNVDSYKGTV